jgi:hypothetical protein
MSEVIRFLESMGRNPAITAGEFPASRGRVLVQR